MMKPFISVIVPIYNVEKYLEKCLNSLLNQTYEHYEIILVDDGSPDRCGEICDEFKLKSDKITVLHIPNGGVCNARNQGMEIAKGDFFCFVDSDDWVEKNYLKDFAENIDDEYTMVQQDFYRDFPHKQSSFELQYNDNSYDLKTEYGKMIAENRVIFAGFVWNKIFLARIIRENKIQFDGSTKLADDEEFNLVYIRYIKRVKNISKANYHYIDNPNSITKRKLTFEMEFKRFLFQSSYFDFVRKHYDITPIVEKYISNLNFSRFEHSIYRKYILNSNDNSQRIKFLDTIYASGNFYFKDLTINAKGTRKIEYQLLTKKKTKSLIRFLSLKKKIS